MAYDVLTKKSTARDWSCGGFEEEARRAMKEAPGYFAWWYTIKSVGLGVAVAGLGFMLGRESTRR